MSRDFGADTGKRVFFAFGGYQSDGIRITFSKRFPVWPDIGNVLGKTKQYYLNHYLKSDNQEIYRKRARKKPVEQYEEQKNPPGTGHGHPGAISQPYIAKIL